MLCLASYQHNHDTHRWLNTGWLRKTEEILGLTVIGSAKQLNNTAGINKDTQYKDVILPFSKVGGVASLTSSCCERRVDE